MFTQWISNGAKDKSAAFPSPLSVTRKGQGILQHLGAALKKILYKFSPTEWEKKEDYIRQMFYLAQADQRLSDEEMAYILRVGQQIELKAHRIHEISRQAAPRFLKLPSKNRFFYVFHLVDLLRVGKEVSQEAMQRAQSLLMKQGYAPDTVDIILTTIEQNEQHGISPEQTYDFLKESLG
jgi:hypothetical protein